MTGLLVAAVVVMWALANLRPRPEREERRRRRELEKRFDEALRAEERRRLSCWRPIIMDARFPYDPPPGAPTEYERDWYEASQGR
jgi:hypothetical protein